MMATTEPPDALSGQLARWADAGLLSTDQAARIQAWEAERSPFRADAVGTGTVGTGTAGPAPTAVVAASAGSPAAPARRERGPLLVEALAYLGGVIILAAVIVVVSTYWETLARSSRAGLAGGATALLLLAGWLIRPHLGMFAVRLRGALWLLSTACWWGLLVTLTEDSELPSQASFLIVNAAVTVYAGALWLLHRSVLQHIGGFLAAELLVMALCTFWLDWQSLAVGATWVVVGLLWAVLAWWHLLPGTSPRRLPPAGVPNQPAGASDALHRRVGLIVGSIGMGIGSLVISVQSDHPWLGLLPIALMLTVAAITGDLPMLAIGAVATLIALPAVVDHYFVSTLAVALALLAAGAVLVVMAVLIARRRSRSSRSTRSPDEAPAAAVPGAPS